LGKETEGQKMRRIAFSIREDSAGYSVNGRRARKGELRNRRRYGGGKE
jgi:hypothetical protein